MNGKRAYAISNLTSIDRFLGSFFSCLKFLVADYCIYDDQDWRRCSNGVDLPFPIPWFLKVLIWVEKGVLYKASTSPMEKC